MNWRKEKNSEINYMYSVNVLKDIKSKEDESGEVMNLKEYSVKMRNKMDELQHNMNQFNKNLISVHNRSKSFGEIQNNILQIESKLSSIYKEINSIQPPYNYKTLHNSVKTGSSCYVQGVKEFLKFYNDNNDQHFIKGGNLINQGTKLMKKAANMF